MTRSGSRRNLLVSAAGVLLAALIVASTTSAGASHRNVQILDACDPATFNAALSEVAAFGGGCVPEINELLGLEPVPECSIADIFATTGVPPGARLTTHPLDAGTHRFMCLIHPWQKTTANAR